MRCTNVCRQVVSDSRAIESVCAFADNVGMGTEFRSILEAAQKNELFARPYVSSIMYTPPRRHDRMLFTVWAGDKTMNTLKAFIGTDVFAEFFPISEEKATEILGPSGWRELRKEDVEPFIDRLNCLFEMIREIKE